MEFENMNFETFPTEAWKALSCADPVDGTSGFRGSVMAAMWKKEGETGPEFEWVYDANTKLVDWFFENAVAEIKGGAK